MLELSSSFPAELSVGLRLELAATPDHLSSFLIHQLLDLLLPGFVEAASPSLESHHRCHLLLKQNFDLAYFTVAFLSW